MDPNIGGQLAERHLILILRGTGACGLYFVNMKMRRDAVSGYLCKSSILLDLHVEA